MNKLELLDQKFGKLLVIKEEGRNKKGYVLWKCLCDCGNTTLVCSNDLKRENGTKSCGCLIKKHGMYGTPTYNTWSNMLQRCKNPNNTNYPGYGGRGITVCDSWLCFENFYKDMGIRPEGLSVERIDNDDGYYPDNCKWATPTEQQRNKRMNRNNLSGTIGVFYDNFYNKYVARIMVDYKAIHLGYFKDKQKAINARKQAEQRYIL